jgi:hypothetical protein
MEAKGFFALWREACLEPRQRITAPAQLFHDWPIEGIDEAQAKHT